MEFWARWAHEALWHASLWHMHEVFVICILCESKFLMYNFISYVVLLGKKQTLQAQYLIADGHELDCCIVVTFEFLAHLIYILKVVYLFCL